MSPLHDLHTAFEPSPARITPPPVPMEKITVNELAAAIQTALDLPAGPREAAAARLRACDGRGDIVRRVEAMASFHLDAGPNMV